MNQSRPFRKPPDVEEALSSMLWTPYDNNASDSDSSLDDGPSSLIDRLALTPGRYNNSGIASANNNHLQATSIKRSFSEWNYRSYDDGTKAGSLHPHVSAASNRYSYPYYGFHPTAAAGVNGYWNSNNIHPNGYPTAPTNATATTTTIYPVLPPLDWKQIRSTATGIYQPPAAPMSPTMVVPAMTATTATPLLPFSLLGVDSIPLGGGIGPTTLTLPSAAYGFCEDDLINSNMMIGVNDTFGDYQVYPITPAVHVGAAGGGVAYLSHPSNIRHQQPSSMSSSSSAASGYGLSNDGNNNSSNVTESDYHYDNNNSLCRISAMLKPVMRSTSSHSGNVGDLHSSKDQQRPQHSSIENATGSCSAITGGAATNESYVGCSSDERPKRNGQSISPFNGYHHVHMAGGCEGEAADDERCDGRDCRAAATGFDRDAFSSVRIVNGETYACGDLFASERRLFAATERQTIERVSSSSDNNSAPNSNTRGSSWTLDNLRGIGRSVRDRFVEIMRLNVPAAPEGSRTSVYIPSSEATALVTDSAMSHGEGGPRPTLTIQVNCVDTNNEVQNDVVNNVSSGVSIVNCYRETPRNSVECFSDKDSAEAAMEGQFYSSDVNSASLNPTVVDKNHVNISANAEQMVHVSNTVVQGGSNDPNLIEHSYDKKSSAAHQTSPQLTDIDRIEPANNRTYTSTEAQTDDPPIPIGHEVVPPYVHQSPMMPPPLLLSPPPGSEFSTREHRRRERRERRQARNRMQHVHPMDQPPPPPSTMLRPPPPPPTMLRPPPIEIIPDILHSHLPPPYTTLPMGATVLPAPAAILPAVVHPAVAVHQRAAGPVGAEDCRYSFPIPIMRSSPSERSRKGCCGHWFAGPPLRALIAVVALGGVACALGGAALGATGLAGSPTSHLTAALLMIGVGVILVTVSGAAWRMTAPGAPPCLGLGSTVDLGRCSRRPCGRSGSTPHGLLYPEFQHRPPPPSYQASMQEYRLRLLLLDRDRQSGRIRSTASPPPTYRSNVGSLLRIPLTSRYNSSHANGATSGGSSTSIFGGISGIISGAMGSSTTSINGITTQPQPTASATAADRSTPTTSLLSDPAGAPPPTYRTIDRRNSSTSIPSSLAAGITTAAPTGDHQVQVQRATSSTTATTTPTDDSTGAIVEGGVSLINDDSTGPARTGTGAGSAPSIIKIDNGKSTADTTVGPTSDPAPPHRQRNSITNEIIENDSNRADVENVANKDLVTIVTISGTLEQKQQQQKKQKQPNLNKSAVDGSAGSNAAISKTGRKSKTSDHAGPVAPPGKL
ncbi:uncharacterized protein LOC134210843 [Armigeres subalbatus]|uniref:uncharacterized protein LOC134210843 n=1 Tax=Armigeres subalbatus TaxID=124917 RepID=UPI002ED0C691